jgi:crotonobetainyl-CoA:carnitine CoA-transferase CaiB-like acyl-CoA transferase
MCAMLGRPELPKDPRFTSHEGRAANMGELLEIVAAWFAARSFDDAVKSLLAHDVPHAPIMSMADIFTDPHYRERQTIIDVPSDIGPLPQPTVVPRLSGTPGRVTHAGPRLGHHTDEVLGSLLGLSHADIAKLRADRVI